MRATTTTAAGPIEQRSRVARSRPRTSPHSHKKWRDCRGPLSPLAEKTASTKRWLHTDQLGSIRLTTTTTGATSSTATWDAYGNPTMSSGTATILGWAGEQADPETGLVYLRARHYDPATAQFLNRDPVTAETRSPYGYVAGNPLNLVDPLGLYAYSLDYKIGKGDYFTAATLMLLMQAKPDDMFPFTVPAPIAKGAQLHLTGQYDIGTVTVTGLGSTWFSFRTHGDHKEGGGANIMFELYADADCNVHLRIDANGPDGRLQKVPIIGTHFIGPIANKGRELVARDTWSHMALNLRRLAASRS